MRVVCDDFGEVMSRNDSQIQFSAVSYAPELFTQKTAECLCDDRGKVEHTEVLGRICRNFSL